MTFNDTRFARELAAVIVGLLFAVATIGFVTVPITLGEMPGSVRLAATTIDWHPT